MKKVMILLAALAISASACHTTDPELQTPGCFRCETTRYQDGNRTWMHDTLCDMTEAQALAYEKRMFINTGNVQQFTLCTKVHN